jgi:hypothetical protein
MTDPERQEWENNPENKVISEGEIAKIEAITNALRTPEGQEQTMKKLDQVDNDFLNDIKDQALHILNLHVDGENASFDDNELKAIYSLLKIQQIQRP